MSVGLKSAAAFILGMMFILAVGVAALLYTRRFEDASQSVTHTHLVIERLEHVLLLLDDAETSERGFLLTGEKRYLEPYRGAATAIEKDIDATVALTSDNPPQQQDLDQVRELARAKLAISARVVALRKTAGFEPAAAVVRSGRAEKIMDQLRVVIATMETREQRLLTQCTAAAATAADRALWTVALWMLVALLVLGIAAVLMARSGRFGGAGPALAMPRSAAATAAIRYVCAVVFVVVAIVLYDRLVAVVGGPLPVFITLYPAVLLAAAIGGGGPGILATALAALLADYYILPPVGSFRIDAPNDMLALGIFTATGIGVSVLMERLRRSRWAEAVAVARQAQLDELSRLNDELSRQSEELSQQSEELSQNNEELQSQSEELSQQYEELQGQAEEIQGLYTDLEHREDLLQSLLDVARLSGSEQQAMQDVCAAAVAMFGAPPVAVAVYEQEGEQLMIRATAGLDEEGREKRPVGNALRGVPATAGLDEEGREKRPVGNALRGVPATAGLDEEGREKGDRHLLCEAPEGPFRQKVPVPLFPAQPAEHTFAELVIHENKTACLNDASLRPDLAMLATAGAPFCAVLCAPMRAEGRAFGAVCVYGREKREWTAQQFRLVEWLAGQCAHILEALRLQAQLRRLYAEQRTIFDSVPAMIWYKDAKNNFVRVNRAVASVVGRPAEEIEGRSAYELFPDEAEKYYQDDLEVLRSGQPKLGIIEPMGIAGGEKRWVETDKVPYRDEAGNVAGILLFTTDITERKAAELERETTVDFLQLVNRCATVRDLVEQATGFFHERSGCEAVGIRLRQGDDFPYFETRGFPSEFVQQETHLCARDAAGQPVRDAQGNPLIECMCGHVICGRFDPAKPFFTGHGSFWTNCTTELLASTTEADRQSRTRNRCNGEGYESVALVPMGAGAERLGLLQLNDRRKGQFSPAKVALWERLAGHLAVALAKLRAEESLRENVEELRRSNQELEQFAYVASHDLQEPLRQVRAFVQLLQKHYRDGLDTKAAQYMQFVVEGAGRMSDLVRDLLAYSRVGAGRQPRQRVSSQEALDIALANLRSAIAEAGADVTHDGLPTLSADRTQLVQLFQNLVGNAVKFRRDGEPPRVHVAARRDGRHWVFSVRDNGIGIAPEHHDRIFLIFQRLHGREKYSGTGIGLSICKKIVEQYRGKIWLQSTFGEGSVFYFSVQEDGERGIEN